MTVLEPILHGLDSMVRKVEHLCEEWPQARRHLLGDIAVDGAQADRRAPRLGTVRSELVNLPGFAEEIAWRYEAVARQRSIRMTVDIPPDALVFGDAARVRQMVEASVVQVLERASCGDRIALTAKVEPTRVILDVGSHAVTRPADPVHSLLHFPATPAPARRRGS